jgi:hypothetical protein
MKWNSSDEYIKIDSLEDVYYSTTLSVINLHLILLISVITSDVTIE